MNVYLTLPNVISQSHCTLDYLLIHVEVFWRAMQGNQEVQMKCTIIVHCHCHPLFLEVVRGQINKPPFWRKHDGFLTIFSNWNAKVLLISPASNYRLRLKFSCMMELSRYPLDTQVCAMQISSCKYFVSQKDYIRLSMTRKFWLETRERIESISFSKSVMKICALLIFQKSRVICLKMIFYLGLKQT